MSNQQLGELPLKDYLNIVRPGLGARKRVIGVLAALACVFSFCAGRFGPWSGKGADKLSLSDALAILEQAPVEAWEHELGVYAVHRNVTRALDTLAEVARKEGPASGDAGRSLRHLLRRGIRYAKELAISSHQSAIHNATLDLLREDLSK